MKSILSEFKEFIMRGNVVDLAVAVVVGAAFTQVVNSFAKDVLMQVVGIFTGKPDFSGLHVTINHSEIHYGNFLTAVVNFLIVAVAMFLVIKAINSHAGPASARRGRGGARGHRDRAAHRDPRRPAGPAGLS